MGLSKFRKKVRVGARLALCTLAALLAIQIELSTVVAQTIEAGSPEPGQLIPIVKDPDPTPPGVPGEPCVSGQIYSRLALSPNDPPQCRVCKSAGYQVASASVHNGGLGLFYNSNQWFIPSLTQPCNPLVENCAATAYLRKFYAFFIERVNACNYWLNDAITHPGVHPESGCSTFFSVPRYDAFGNRLFFYGGGQAICYYAFNGPDADSFNRCMHYSITGDLKNMVADGSIFGGNGASLASDPYFIAPGDVPTVDQLSKWYYTQCFGIENNPQSPSGFSLRSCEADDCLVAATASNASPISLMWEPHDFSAETGRVVSFPLDRDGSSGWTLWRASAKAPLLVFLGETPGKITGARQLFGNWTAGGKGDDKKPVPWRDGFEALAQMDSDKDGRIVGTELDQLGLWFDKNRDGVHDRGEVKTAGEAGLSALFYKMAKTENDGNVWLDVGFERISDGKVVSGASVDWYAPVAKTAADLASLLSRAAGGPNQGAPTNDREKKVGRDDKQSVLVTSSRGRQGSSPLSGIWEYAVDGGQGVGGLLALYDLGDATLAGTSLVVAAQRGGGSGQLTMHRIKGEMDWLHNTGSLTIITAQGTQTKSSIYLGTDGTIHGSTVASFGGPKNNGAYRYGWTAHKMPQSVVSPR